MDFSDVTKIIELHSCDDVNKHIAVGWKLLDIYNTAYDVAYPGCNHQNAHFILGWTTGTPTYPKNETNDLDGFF